MICSNHLITWERTKFDTEPKSLKFLLEIRHQGHQQIILVLAQNIFSGESHSYICPKNNPWRTPLCSLPKSEKTF